MTAGSAVRGQNAPAINLEVDATEASRGLFHSKVTLPAAGGPMTLVYPKWVPGDHSPSGPIVNVVALKITAGGKPVPWKRDEVDMFAFHLEVPQGATTVEASFDLLSPSDAATTPNIAVLEWNQVVLYPQNKTSDEVTFAAKLKLPGGWKSATALQNAGELGGWITYKPVSLTRLVDSPVLAGSHVRVIPLNQGQSPAHEIDLVSDSTAALEMKAETIAGYGRLVDEAGALFGARHYTGYHWLVVLSDHTAHFGLEHHESSDNRTFETVLSSESGDRSLAGLLAHEYVHSWNGKYRRPAGLATPNYQEPMKGELLWVYEGLTTYLGTILPPRAGLWTPEALRDNLAGIAAGMEHTTGREWRPLEDTTVAAQILYGAPRQWKLYRRTVDFYDEGLLIWLDADVTIRQLTQGKKSLDDFCKAFHGGANGDPFVKPYTFDDVVNALNSVVAHDWRGFLQSRINGPVAHAPLNGITNSGWKLVYTDQPGVDQRERESRRNYVDVTYSLGLQLDSSNVVIDLAPGLPADKAGLAPGMKLVAVNGRKISREVLQTAVKESKTATTPLELLVENDEFYKTYSLDYHGGLRYPHLERDESKPDLLSDIIKPAAARK